MIKTNYSNRVFGLDIMRAFAILFVMYGHGEIIIEKYINKPVYEYFIFDGVTIFFVLSGFLIGGILLKIINTTDFTFPDLLDFWKRRWFRTVPNYFLVLSLLIVSGVLLHKGMPIDWYRYYFFVQNFNRPMPDFFGESWSLSVEEWFYLTVPFILMVCLSLFKSMRREKVILWVAIAIICLVTALRIYKVIMYQYYHTGVWDDITIKKEVISRLDSIMYGFIAAFLRFYNYPIWSKYNKPFFIIGILIFLLVNAFSLRNTIFLLPLESIGAAMLLPFLCNVKTGPALAVRFFTTISILSYSMYLLNRAPIRKILMPLIFKWLHFDPESSFAHSFIAYWLFMGLTVFLSYVLYHVYEKRMTELREKIGKK